MMTSTVDTISQQPVEAWVAIPGFPKLEASTLGRIRSFIRGDKVNNLPYRILHTSPGKNGYLTLRGIDADGVSITRHAHALIASAFLGPKPDGMLILHTNDVKTDNRPSNLRYGTARDNYADSVINGGRIVGLTNPNQWAMRSKLTAQDVRIMRRQFAAGMKMREIAEARGVTTKTARNAVKGRTFAWVGADAAETEQTRANAEAARALAKAQVAMKRSTPHTAPKSAPTSKGYN